MYATMPIIDLNALREQVTDEEFAILRRCIATQGKNKGRLRASKPMVNRQDPLSGKAAYVWRNIAFLVSPVGQHQCIPVTAEWDLPIHVTLPPVSDPAYSDCALAKHEARRQMSKELDTLVDKVVNTIPKEEWYGVTRWARALGQWERPQGEI